MTINFISSKDSDGIHTMHAKSNNIEIMIGNKMDEIIGKIFDSVLQKYWEKLEKSMKGSEFVFDSVDSLHYKFHKISLSRGGSYIVSPNWLKNKKATINPKNNDGKCFQYAVTVALNHEQVKKEIEFPSHKKDWKKLELNNKSVALNVLYVPDNIEKVGHVYMSKHNQNHESQAILLMITDGKKWHYLAVKELSASFRVLTQKNNRDVYVLK